MSVTTVEIISTAHWDGDPRLNRHVQYLRRAGDDATLTTFSGYSRIAAIARVLIAVVRSRASVVILPDPEMFLPGSLAARLTGKRPVVDIHEDYGKAAMARPWAPDLARPVVRSLANALVLAGRIVAWRVMVAAPQLSRPGDFVALNIPDPDSLDFTEHDGSKRLVYVGDLTRARGAVSMVEVLGHLDEEFELLLIGGGSETMLEEIEATARREGVADRVRLSGRLDPADAWSAARGALAGLNLLSPAPAYLDTVATKLWEYMAVGLPPIVSDLPGQSAVVSQIDENLVCDSAASAAAVAQALDRDAERRTSLAAIGRRLVEDAWEKERPDLVVQEVVRP